MTNKRHFDRGMRIGDYPIIQVKDLSHDVLQQYLSELFINLDFGGWRGGETYFSQMTIQACTAHWGMFSRPIWSEMGMYILPDYSEKSIVFAENRLWYAELFCSSLSRAFFPQKFTLKTSHFRTSKLATCLY